MSRLRSLWFAVLGTSVLFASGRLPAEEGKAVAPKNLRVLVVAGGHRYDVKLFREIFKNYADLECTFRDEKNTAEAFDDISNWPYDAVVLYNYKKTPTERQVKNITTLLDRGMGLVILHHAIYGYRPWPEFQKLVGITSWLDGSKDDVDMKIHVADLNHPITQGVTDFDINDETYDKYEVDPKVHVLLTTDTPGNGKNLAWTHTYRNSPVFYLQLGHGPKAYKNPSFVTLLENGIRWAAKEAESK
jgi:uncharacterized protein